VRLKDKIAKLKEEVARLNARPLPRHGRAPRWNRTSAPNPTPDECPQSVMA
jgi:hypothetical protein